jgi:hypothetical protein
MAEQYDEGGFKQQFEAAIPILIILLLVIGVIALNPSIVRGVPVLGDLFGKPAVNILVIGESATEANDWNSFLKTDLAIRVFGSPPNVEVITDAQYNRVSSPDWLDSQGYGVVIVTAEDLTPALQLTLSDWAQKGGRLLVLGKGGVQTNQRWASLEAVLPVRCGATGDCSGVVTQVYAPTLYVKEGQFGNGLAKNVDKATPLTAANGSINVADVTVVGSELLYIGGFKDAGSVKAGATGDYHPGVSESTQVAGGKVVYVSFNPTRENIATPVKESLAVNILAYMLGLPGYQSA